MTSTLSQLKPAVAASLAAWHEMIERRDMGRLASIVHPDAAFRSPMAFNAYASAEAVVMVLGTVIDVFEDFAYHRQLASEDGLSVVPEFSARVGDRKLKGIDLIQFDADGRIVDFEVMVRPLSGLQALGQAMGERLGSKLPAFKTRA